MNEQHGHQKLVSIDEYRQAIKYLKKKLRTLEDRNGELTLKVAAQGQQTRALQYDSAMESTK